MRTNDTDKYYISKQERISITLAKQLVFSMQCSVGATLMH